MTKTRKITYIVLLFVVAALLVLGGLYDLAIDEALYAPDNIVARIFESVGIFPPFVFVGATLATLFFVLDDKKKCYLLKRVLCVAGTATAYFVFGYMAINETSLTISWLPYVAGIGAAAVFAPLTLWILSRVENGTRRRLLVFLLFGTIIAFVANLLLVNVLKFIWSRPRYREMVAAGNFDIYSPWYVINSFSLHGHHSFPSGHTASACSLFVLCALGEVFPKYREKEATIAFIVGLYTITMAYSRIVLGAHFLSDVTAGFAITFITYAVTRYFYFKHFPIADILGENMTEEIEEAENAETSIDAEETPNGAEEAVNDTEETQNDATTSETEPQTDGESGSEEK
ncbi:MAG: phosphatase PAP2 family protein [Clostridia bacterium]|nr:phosphatase PAP2 family protein [Clostridia bacterium]